jgi:hypothetical protein
MRTASHIAAALSAATGRSTRPNDWRLVGTCMGYLGSSRMIDWAELGSRLKPE